MFIQVIEGKASDPEGFRRVIEEEVPTEGAIGFLGSTTAIAPDGNVVTMARFESEEKAMQNSARPETSAFAEKLQKYAAGAPTYHNCNEVTLFRGGGSNDAGFVQMMIGTVADKARAQAIDERMEKEAPDLRPDLIGIVTAWDGNWYCQCAYFTSEEEARAGEKEMDNLSGETKALLEEMFEAYGEIRFVDGPNPIIR